jgi:hypothetical protein
MLLPRFDTANFDPPPPTSDAANVDPPSPALCQEQLEDHVWFEDWWMVASWCDE